MKLGEALGWKGLAKFGANLIHSSADHHLVYVWDLRAIRSHLADLGLDWEAPPFPDAATSRQAARARPLICFRTCIGSAVRPW